MKNNQPDNQQLSRQKLDSFRPMTTARSEMIKMRLQNMQLQHTSRNAILVEENLTQKLCKRIKRFVKKFLQKNASNLTFKTNAKPQMQLAKVQMMNTEGEKNLSESRLSPQSSRISNPAKCPSGSCRACSLDKPWVTIIPNPVQRTSTQVKQQVSSSMTELTASGVAASLMNRLATGTFLCANKSSRQIR